MRDDNDKSLEKKRVVIRENVAFLLVDVLRDKGDFHSRCWIEFFHGLLDYIHVIIAQFVVEK